MRPACVCFLLGKKRATKAAHSQLDDSTLHHALIPQNSTEYGMMLADLQNHDGSGGAQMHGQKWVFVFEWTCWKCYVWCMAEIEKGVKYCEKVYSVVVYVQ